MKRIIITGAGGSAGINFAKSLRLAHEKFWLVGTDTDRFFLELPPVDARYLVPKATDTEKYLDSLNRVIKRENVDLLHPQPDIEVNIISENREKIDAKTFLPSKSAIKTCHDKHAAIQAFKKAGVPVPESFKLTDRDSLREGVDRVGLPAWVRTRDPRFAFAMKVDSFEQAKLWLEFWLSKSQGSLHWEDFTINEFIPGKVYGWQSVWKDGEMITSQGRVRLEWIKTSPVSPTGAGTSAVQMTVTRKELDDVSIRAIKAVDERPNGVLSVDSIEDANGKLRVTEINLGRFYTTSLFFPACGINVPYIFVLCAYDELSKMGSIEKYSPIPEGYYWVRNMDADPMVIKGEKWRSTEA